MANELAISDGTFHELETVEDYARFVLIGNEVLKAQRAELKAMQKVGVAKEFYEAKQKDAQRAGELVLDAKFRLGELTQVIKPQQGRRTDITSTTNGESKGERLKAMGLNDSEVSRYEKLAEKDDDGKPKYTAIIETEKQSAREENRMPSQTRILNKIKELNKQVDKDAEMAKKIRIALSTLANTEITGEAVCAWINFSDGNYDRIKEAERALNLIKKFYFESFEEDN